ncbi:hypothetical protein AAFF_G00104940 [Aldrovandia affinis]|uniref:EGF-like domain-containing protein n=1 Tax=Aldrovandia affinis TaxID=143900 RepID=A0AAD7T348_9TELE|nr:hypothetical protein AAFF_G00104940 [Aldrovandia affinis]
MAEHGGPCEAAEASYCMNGAACYKIPSVLSPTCVCAENYRGSRCEQFQLFSSSGGSGETGLIIAVVIVALFILVALAVVIYCCKTWRQKSNGGKGLLRT